MACPKGAAEEAMGTAKDAVVDQWQQQKVDPDQQIGDNNGCEGGVVIESGGQRSAGDCRCPQKSSWSPESDRMDDQRKNM